MKITVKFEIDFLIFIADPRCTPKSLTSETGSRTTVESNSRIFFSNIINHLINAQILHKFLYLVNW